MPATAPPPLPGRRARLPAWAWAAAALVVLPVAWFWLRTPPPMQKRTRFLMDTICTIQAPGGREVIPALDRALDRAEAVDQKFNCLNPVSPLYAFNQRGTPISDPEIVGVVRAALEVSRQSGGALDPTVYPLVRLWGFFTPHPRRPSAEEIRAALPRVGYRYLVIAGGQVRKTRPDVGLDLGAVAKGYAVGEAVKVLKQAGLRSALVDFGGDIYALGTLRGRDWKVGIRDPRGEGVIGVLEISDLSVATSGDYERFFEQDGVRYHHILDPQTGYPARGLISLTVISPDATLADAWSTALFVLGRERALGLAEQGPLQGAVMVTPDRKISYSAGLGRQLTKPKRRR